jgi:hypothetical protein
MDTHGLLWYECEEDFKAIRALIPPEESKHFPSFEKQLIIQEGSEKRLREGGLVPIRVPIKSEKLKVWAQANNVPVRIASIEDYAMEMMSKYSSGTSE